MRWVQRDPSFVYTSAAFGRTIVWLPVQNYESVVTPCASDGGRV